MGSVVQCAHCGEKSQLPEPQAFEVEDGDEAEAKAPARCLVCGVRVKVGETVCDTCQSARKNKQLRAWIAWSVVGVTVIGVGAFGAWKWVQSRRQPADLPVKTLLAQPPPMFPKSIANLRPGRFSLEKRRGSDLLVAVGDIENISQNAHSHIRADVEVFDKSNTKIGVVSDYSVILGAYQTWHFIAQVPQTNAFSVRFAGLKEDE
jgi:predicted nucleic acid-binding Zn ribbon protein